MFLLTTKERPDHFTQLRKMIITHRRSEQWPVFTTVFAPADQAEQLAKQLSLPEGAEVTVFNSEDTAYITFINGEKVVNEVNW